jgi:hypothetical protein
MMGPGVLVLVLSLQARPDAAAALRAVALRPALAVGASVIKCPSPLNVLKATYEHLAVIEYVQINIST